jgi:exonuclease III
MFSFAGYKLIFNSPTAARGVGILISQKINHEIIDTRGDRDGNILVAHLVIGGENFTIGSVYGPNDNDLSFFRTLEGFINDLKNEYIILGGDWNLTPDPRPVGENLDVINMANIPSRTRSLAFNALSDRLDLKDAYRILYPNTREFTYIPNANLNINRSRLDFFMISTALAVQKFSTGIGSALSSKSFDHKKFFSN